MVCVTYNDLSFLSLPPSLPGIGCWIWYKHLSLSCQMPLSGSCWTPSLLCLMLVSLPPELERAPTTVPLSPHQSTDATVQKKAYRSLEQLLTSESHTHQAFVRNHLKMLTSVISESLSTSSTASKKVSRGGRGRKQTRVQEWGGAMSCPLPSLD